MLALLLPGIAAASGDADIQHAVETVIMDRHPHDTPDWWRGLGAGAPAVIEQLYGTDTSTYHQMRLLEGLGAFTDDSAAVSFIEQQAEQTPDAVVRNAAIRSIAAGQGASQEDWVAKFLHNEDPHTRLLAAELLRKMGTASASAKVSEFMSGEKQPWVLAALRGEAPKPSGQLTPSGSSEDRLSPEFTGTWRGYWLAPRTDSQVGMTNEPVELKLSVHGVDALSGDLRLKQKSRIRSMSLVEAYRQVKALERKAG